MTISSETRKAGPTPGNGVATAFPFAFKVFTAADVSVVLNTLATGVQQTLVLNTDYTVILNPDQNANPGGTVTYNPSGVPMPATQTLTIGSVVTRTQGTHLINGGSFLADNIENMVDRAVICIQQMAEQLARSIRFPFVDNASLSAELPAAAQRASKYLAFDATGVPFAAAAQSGVPTSAFMATVLDDATSNAALTTLTVTRTGAVGNVPITLLDKELQVVSIMEFMPDNLRAGIKARTNVTELGAFFQAALTDTRVNGTPTDAGKMLYVNAGKYKVSSNQTVGTGQFVFFDPNVEIDARALPTENTHLFSIANQTDVSFEGNGATIVGAAAIAVSGATWNSVAFSIYGSDNVTLRNFKIQLFAGAAWHLWGDDVGSGPSENCVIERIRSEQCGRNGAEILSAKNCVILGGMYRQAGTVTASPGGPWAGIDIEPNSDCYIENVSLINVGTYQNKGSGLQVTPGSLATVAGKKFFVTIIGGQSEEDGDTVAQAGLHFKNGGAQANKIFGRVLVQNYVVKNPRSMGIAVYNWDADKCPSVVLNDCSVYDPDFTQVAATNALRTGMVINADAACAVANLGNVYVRNLYCEDTRAGGAIRMPWGVLLAASAGKKVKNVVMQDVRSVNYVAAAKGDVNTAVTAVSILEDVYVTYTDGRPFSSGNTALDTMGGTVVRPNGSGGLYTLPAAAWCKGLSYIVENPIGTNGTSVRPTAGDTISWAADVISTDLVLDDGAKAVLTSDGVNGWKAQITGPYRKGASGLAAPKKIWHAAAVPAAGTHAVGDRAFNSAPAVGNPKSWVCTVAGTPGTWVSEGNL